MQGDKAEYYTGQRVLDHDGDIGTVVSAEDLHNIRVKYDHGGSALICVAEGCHMQTELAIVEDFGHKLTENQRPLDADIVKLVNENFFDLI